MRRGFDGLVDLRDDALEYIELQWSLVRLRTVEKLSTGIGAAVGWGVFGLLALLAVGFMLVALAMWVGQKLGSEWLGFLIVGGGLLLVGIIFLVVVRRAITNGMVRKFTNMFFTYNEHRHGTRA